MCETIDEGDQNSEYVETFFVCIAQETRIDIDLILIRLHKPKLSLILTDSLWNISLLQI